MCTVSMVYDHYRDQFPNWPQPPTSVPGTGGDGSWLKDLMSKPTVDLALLRTLINEFKEAVEAAKKLDALMRQPDCTDPEKAKLQERVNKLEKVVNALMESP